MDVIEQRKIDRAVSDLRSRGVRTSTAAPLHNRLLWRLGVPLPPPHFMPFRQAALNFGASYMLFAVPLTMLFEWTGFSSGYTMAGTVLRLGVTGAAWGWFMADRFRAQARQMQLPPWSDYVPDGSAAGDESRR